MLDSINLGITAVFPLLTYMAVGGGIKKLGWVNEKTLDELNKVAFRILLSLLVFLNAYSVDMQAVTNKESQQIIVISLAAVAIAFSAALLISGRFILNRKRKAIIVQGIFRSNIALYGLPISIAIYGEGHQGAAAILISVLVPIYNVIATFLLNDAAQTGKSKGSIILKPLTNPLVLGSVLGLQFNVLNIPILQQLLNSMEGLSKAATPLAFMILGGSLTVSSIKKNKKAILSVSAIRLILCPSAVIGVAIIMGIKGPALVALIGAFASPIAVSSHSMAKELDVEPDLAGELVAATTLLSMFTMFLWIALLGYYNYL